VSAWLLEVMPAVHLLRIAALNVLPAEIIRKGILPCEGFSQV